MQSQSIAQLCEMVVWYDGVWVMGKENLTLEMRMVHMLLSLRISLDSDSG